MVAKKHEKHLTFLYYSIIGLTGTIILLESFYWSLTQTSSLTALLGHQYDNPYYLPLYLGLSFATALAFGINLSFMAYRWRLYGSPFSLKSLTSSGLGAFIGIIASACPVCGTTLLSAFGVFGGLALLPFSGLELKGGALFFMILPIWYMWKDTNKTSCSSGLCSTKRNHIIKSSEYYHLGGILLIFLLVTLMSVLVISKDPFFTKELSAAESMCPASSKK